MKADNVNNMFMENIGAIADSVNTFNEMEDLQITNDPALLYQKEEENYELEIQKLQHKLAKQQGQQDECDRQAAELAEEVTQLEDERD